MFWILLIVCFGYCYSIGFYWFYCNLSVLNWIFLICYFVYCNDLWSETIIMYDLYDNDRDRKRTVAPELPPCAFYLLEEVFHVVVVLHNNGGFPIFMLCALQKQKLGNNYLRGACPLWAKRLNQKKNAQLLWVTGYTQNTTHFLSL